MGHFQVQGSTDQTTHQCTSHREGNWTIWRCPQCQGYERRFNWVTNEMRVRTGGSEALHSGMNTQSQNMEALTTGLSYN